MTTFVQMDRSTRHVARPKRAGQAGRGASVLATVSAAFKLWAAVRREMAEISRSPSLSARSQRLMRSYY